MREFLFFLQDAFVSHKTGNLFTIVKLFSSFIIFIKKKKREHRKKRGVSLRVCIVQFVLKQFCKTSQLSQPFLKKKKKTLVSLVDLGG